MLVLVFTKTVSLELHTHRGQSLAAVMKHCVRPACGLILSANSAEDMHGLNDSDSRCWLRQWEMVIVAGCVFGSTHALFPLTAHVLLELHRRYFTPRTNPIPVVAAQAEWSSMRCAHLQMPWTTSQWRSRRTAA